MPVQAVRTTATTAVTCYVFPVIAINTCVDIEDTYEYKYAVRRIYQVYTCIPATIIARN